MGCYKSLLVRKLGPAMVMSDATLVLGTLEGDTAAFTELYDRYVKLVRAICYDTTGNLEEAGDLAQDAFLRAYDKLNRLKNPERFSPWLVSITRNVCREYRRTKARDRHVTVGLEPPEVLPDKNQDPENRQEAIFEAMARLSDKERLALHVYYVQEYDVEQAKVILGVSRSGLYRLLSSARSKVERYIRKAERNELPLTSPEERE